MVSRVAKQIASYAMQVEESQGRKYTEPPHSYRNDFERDRDRIIHARAFRRLENKTQVFSHRYSDHFRNRLTHTLEVAQISRTVALALGLNTDLVEALALVHDLGHPPFGHAGESLLDRLMQNYGEHFDHNLHALRIVEQLEEKYVSFPGLNLTFEVREGIVKHSRQYDKENRQGLQEYLLDSQPPLEAQLIDVADEIAYNCADLDDGYEAKLLDLETIRRGVPAFDSSYREFDLAYPKALVKLKFNEALKRVLDDFAGDLISHSSQSIERLPIGSVDEVRKQRFRLIGFSAEKEKVRGDLRSLLQSSLYSHEELVKEREKAMIKMEWLFHYYLDHPDCMARFYYEKSCSEPLHRAVCYYIAGMTDNFLQEQYQLRMRGS